MKEFEDDNFNLVKMAVSSSEQVEIIVGKGDIARYEQCLLFPQCFPDLKCRHVKIWACLERVNKRKQIRFLILDRNRCWCGDSHQPIGARKGRDFCVLSELENNCIPRITTCKQKLRCGI